MKNNLTLGLLSTLSILIFATLLITIVNAQENMTVTEEPKFIAIQHAQSGSLSDIKETTYSLELNDVLDKTILVSDRPDRIVTSVSTSEFIDNWSIGTDNFAVDPPNAVLVIDDHEEAVIVELFEPVYDYNANILVYNFNLNNTLDKLSSEFEQSTLIIDNRCGLICDSAS